MPATIQQHSNQHSSNNHQHSEQIPSKIKQIVAEFLPNSTVYKFHQSSNMIPTQYQPKNTRQHCAPATCANIERKHYSVAEARSSTPCQVTLYAQQRTPELGARTGSTPAPRPSPRPRTSFQHRVPGLCASAVRKRCAPAAARRQHKAHREPCSKKSHMNPLNENPSILWQPMQRKSPRASKIPARSPRHRAKGHSLAAQARAKGGFPRASNQARARFSRWRR